MPESPLYIGLMSGTSLDGVDGVIAHVDKDNIRTLATAYLPFADSLRSELMALQSPGENEIHREALAANGIAQSYADCVSKLLAEAALSSTDIQAIGAHGQTIRHRPEYGYTRQTGNPALLAEMTAIDVIADFRSRDIAAKGQGAPLVPAFHQAVFSAPNEIRVVANIGGISNISVLDVAAQVTGFDTGPGNLLMDGWIARHLNQAYDAGGSWAASGKIIPGLLRSLCEEPFLFLPPPKSTGRDLFHMDWLEMRLAAFPGAKPEDVQATLAAFTAVTLADAITTYASRAEKVYVCGGGAYNTHLMAQLQLRLEERKHPASVASTQVLGVSPNHVEALAFAWLAYRHMKRLPGNLSEVTGALGPRMLGALYPK